MQPHLSDPKCSQGLCCRCFPPPSITFPSLVFFFSFLTLHVQFLHPPFPLHYLCFSLHYRLLLKCTHLKVKVMLLDVGRTNLADRKTIHTSQYAVNFFGEDENCHHSPEKQNEHTDCSFWQRCRQGLVKLYSSASQ